MAIDALAGSDAPPDVWALLAEGTDPLRWRPCLAADIETAEFALAGGGTYTIVGNPRSLVHYRLTAQEAAVLPLLNGRNTVGGLTVTLLAGAGTFAPNRIVQLALLLERGGFFDSAFVDVWSALERAVRPNTVRSRSRAFLKSLTIEWTGAERMVEFVYKRGLRYLFTTSGLTVATLISVFGVVAFVAVIRRGDYQLDGHHFGATFVVLIALNFAIIFVHELGHAATLVHFNRRTGSAGFRIYFGSPSFFVDSSDALMLPRWQRILQTAAGPGLELVGTSIAAIALWALPRGQVGDLLYQFVLLNCFVLFLNLVPLLELDGYWIFSDLLRQPDLRPDSLEFVRRTAWRRLRRHQGLTRREVGLLIYGVAGIAFTVAAIISAWFFWQHTFGDTVVALWSASVIARLLLIVLAAFLAGPAISALVDALRAVVRAASGQVARVRFRFERSWRIEAAELLDDSVMFGDVPVDVLNALAGRFRLRSVASGQDVIRQGDVADAYYLVRNGHFEVIEETAGAPRLLRTLGRGEGFGDYGLLRGGRRSTTVRAAERGEVYQLDKATFEQLLASRAEAPTFAPTWQDTLELAALPPFAHLGADRLAILAAQGQWVDRAPGEVVMTQGEPGDAFYVIESGSLHVLEDDVRVNTCGPGEHLGEIALLFDTPRTATVRAATRARLFRVDRSGFQALVADEFRRGALHRNVAAYRDRT